MNSLPVRLFHASLSGIVIAIFITFFVFHVGNRFHTERPKQDIVRVVEREVKKPTPDTPSATYDPNDRDGDGIPNTWETTYSHNPDNAKDAGSDFDFDGLTAKQEYELFEDTGGQYGNPLGKYELSSTTLPDDFASHETTGEPLITSITLIEVAKNGLTLARVAGVLAGAATQTYTNYTYDPFSQEWTRILPPSDVPLSTSMVATDVNSQGQVVGYYYSGGYKGFIWNPPAPGSQSGESKQFYLNPEAVPPNSPTAAIPKRISDTGYLLYSIGSPYSPLKAATHRQLAIEPISGAINPPTYVDVNDYGEYVGVTTNPLTYTTCTFLAIPYGPVYLSELQDHPRAFDATIYGIAAPDVDYTHIQWGEPYTGPNTLDENGNYIGPFVYGSAVDETTQLPVDFRRSLDDSSIWWRDSNNGNIWRKVTANETPAVLNDWGEFAGRFNETLHEDFVYTWYSYDEGGSPTEVIYLDSWSSNGDGVFFFDGSYHLSVTGFNVFGISNDPQILIGSASPTHLWSDSVIAPLAKILPPSTPVTNAKICDGGLMILQSGNFVKILTPFDDADGDGMPDDWEMLYGFNPAVKDSNGDADNDGTNNLGEFLLRSNPNSAPDLTPEGITIDTRDGIDTDGDLIPNVWEYANGLDYLNFDDAALDFDRDGYTNLQEYRLKTDPRGAPAYEIREIGPFTGVTGYSLASAVLGADPAGGDHLLFHATPVTTNGRSRPAVWSPPRGLLVSQFGFYGPSTSISTVSTSLVGIAPSGAALATVYTNPRKFYYWPTPEVSSPIELHGGASSPGGGVIAHNINSLSYASLSPSGNFLVAMRTLASATSTAEWIRWDFQNPPVPLPMPPNGVTLGHSANLRVNDYGHVAGTGTRAWKNVAVFWKFGATSSSTAVAELPQHSGGTISSVIGLSNGPSPVVAGTANALVSNILRDHATVWHLDTSHIEPLATCVDLGTLVGGNTSTLTAISPAGLVAGTANKLVNNSLKSQVIFAYPSSIPPTASSSWTVVPQGAPEASVSVHSINDSGEIIGVRNESNPQGLKKTPILWHHGRAHFLDSILPPSTGYTLEKITAINSNGTLLAIAWKDGAATTILLTRDRDTDGDGMPDMFENRYSLNAFVNNNPPLDSDSDGLNDLDEFRNGTEPRDSDTDDDGMKDGWEVSWGLLPLDPTDAHLDPDNDRVTNLRESQIGTIPTGIYKIETRLIDTDWSYPSVLTAADDGQITYSGRSYFTEEIADNGSLTETYVYDHWALLQAFDSESGIITALPAALQINRNNNDYDSPEYSTTWDQPGYWTDPVNGLIHGSMHRIVNTNNAYGSSWSETMFLIPDAANSPDESSWIPWETVESNLRGGTIDEGDTVYPYADAVSPSGVRRIHQTDMGQRLVLNESGGFIENLPPSTAWQKIDDQGRALALITTQITAANGLPTYDAPEIRFTGYGNTETIPIPHEPGVSPNYTLLRLSNDGKVLLTRSVTNAQFVSITQYHLFDLNTRTLSRVRQPGMGSESVVSISNENGRLLGSGPKPFQITPDGTCIRLEALRIKSSTNAAPLQLSDPSLYPRTLTPNHIASDGRITLTTTNASGQTVILQLVPENDSDGDGMEDDWEKHWAAKLIESGFQFSAATLEMLRTGDLDPAKSLSPDDLTFSQQYEYFSSHSIEAEDETTGPVDTYFFNCQFRYASVGVENRESPDRETYSFGTHGPFNGAYIFVPEQPLYSAENLNDITEILSSWDNYPLSGAADSNNDWSSKMTDIPTYFSYSYRWMDSQYGEDRFFAIYYQTRVRCVVNTVSKSERKFYFLRTKSKATVLHGPLGIDPLLGHAWDVSEFTCQPDAEIIIATVPGGSYTSNWMEYAPDVAQPGFAEASEITPINLRVLPEDEAIVPADSHMIDIPTELDFDDRRIEKADIGWSIVEGSGSLDKTSDQATAEEPDIDTTLNTSTTIGDTYTVEASISKLSVKSGSVTTEVTLSEPLKARTGPIVVGPGEVGNIQFEITPLSPGQEAKSMPADGRSTRTIIAVLKDDFGNPAPAGVQVFWRLEGDGRYTMSETQTDTLGRVRAVLEAGKIPGMAQKVIVEADFKRTELLIENTELNLDLQITPQPLAANESSEKMVFNLAVASDAHTDADVRWWSTRGAIQVLEGSTTDGVKRAQLVIWRNSACNDENATSVVVTATIGSTTSMVSQRLEGDIEVAASSHVLSSSAPASVLITSLAPDSPLCHVTSVQTFKHDFRYFTSSDISANSGVLAGLVNPQSVPSFSLSLAVNPALDSTTSKTLVNAPGAFRIYLDQAQQPCLELIGAEGAQTLVLPVSVTAPAGGGPVEVEFSVAESIAVLSGMGNSVSLKMTGGFSSFATATVPTSSYAMVSSCLGRWKTNKVEQVNITGLIDESRIQLINGSAAFGVAIPPSFSSDEILLNISEDSGAKVYSIRLFVASPAKTQLISDAAELIENAVLESHSNVATTSMALAEVRRYAAEAIANGAVGPLGDGAAGDIRGISDALPPVICGSFEQQAAQSSKYLKWAAKLNGIADEIDKMAEKADSVAVTDGKGRDLFKINVARQVESAMSTAKDTAWNWLGKKLKPLADTIVEANNAAVSAAMESLKGTAVWQEAQEIAEWTGSIPLFQDFATLKSQLTEEGLVELIKALHRTAKAIGKNPQLASVLLVSQLEDFIKPKLNEWAQSGGEAEQVAVAASGLMSFIIQMGPNVATALVDENAVRRMVSQMLGTVLSACVGNKDAQTQLQEMVPYWSWLVMGEQTGELWAARDYYGAGKKAGELILQAVGDLTIVIPVIKGATLAIQGGEKSVQILIQALKKTGTGFAREMNPLDGLANIGKTIRNCPSGISCFPSGVLVLMADGTKKPIESVVKGDMVMADEPLDHEPAKAKRVLGRTEREVEAVLKVELEGAPDIPTTGNHPFWVQNKGWRQAMDLSPGDRLQDVSEGAVTVRGLDIDYRSTAVWNLTVEDSHSFFVIAGERTVLVHNTNPGLRTYIVYVVDLPDGTQYVGRASQSYARGTPLQDAANSCLNRRFKRHHRASKHVGFSVAKPRVIWYDVFSGGNDSAKRAVYGTMRGVEHLYENMLAEVGESANRSISGWKAPIGDQNANKEQYLLDARTRAILKCPSR